MINFTKKTTSTIKKIANMLDITVTSYTKKEEHDAAKIGGGPVVAHYIVYLDNGDIEKIK